MNLFVNWTIYIRFIELIVIILILWAFGFDITKYSSFSGTYDRTLSLPSVGIYAGVLGLWALLYAVYLRYCVDVFNNTKTAYTQLSYAIRDFAIDTNARKKYNGEVYEKLKEHLRSLPEFFFKLLKEDDAIHFVRPSTFFTFGYLGGKINNVPSLCCKKKKKKRKHYQDDDEEENIVATRQLFLFENLKDIENPTDLIDEQFIAHPSYQYSTSKATGLELIDRLETNVSKHNEMVPDNVLKLSDYRKMYCDLYEYVTKLVGINETHRPEFVYNLVTILMCCCNVVFVLITLAALSWTLGILVIFIQIFVFTYLMDGVKTISPSFSKDTEAYVDMLEETNRVQLELIDRLRKVEVIGGGQPLNKKTK